jgi:hypothetical protein
MAIDNLSLWHSTEKAAFSSRPGSTFAVSAAILEHPRSLGIIRNRVVCCLSVATRWPHRIARSRQTANRLHHPAATVPAQRATGGYAYDADFRLEAAGPSGESHQRGVTMSGKVTAVLLITAAVLTNAAFTVLGMVFNYPDVLKEPVEQILAEFRASQDVVMFWFAVLALSAALFVPIALGVGRLSTHRAMRVAVPVGIAAAVVQVIGLSRWPLLVPRFAADAASPDSGVAAGARDSFALVHRVLGNFIGETLGYFFTAVWTLLVLLALGRSLAGLWFIALGAVSAVLVSVGVLSPLDLPVIDLANFIGYVLWSIWLVVFGPLLLLRRPHTATTAHPPAAINAERR